MVGDFVAESLDDGRGIVVPFKDVVIGTEQVAHFAPMLAFVIAQIRAKGQLVDVAQVVFGRAQIPIPEVLIDRVADNGRCCNFIGTHCAGSHQRGIGLGIQLVGHALPVDGAIF